MGVWNDSLELLLVQVLKFLKSGTFTGTSQKISYI